MASIPEHSPTRAQFALPSGLSPPSISFCLRLLGVPRLWVSGAGLPQAQGREVLLRPMVLRLLAALCLDGPQHRLSVADLLWAAPSAQALHNLRTALHALRLALGDHTDAVQAGGSGLSLDLGRWRVDALNLDTARGQALLGAWTGPLLDGHRTGGPEVWLEWLDRHEQRLLEAHLNVLQREAEAAPPELAARLLRRMQDLNPARPSRELLTPQLRLICPPPPDLLGRDTVLVVLRGAQGALHLHGPTGSGRTALAGAAWPDAHWVRVGDGTGDLLSGKCRVIVDDLEALDPLTLQQCALLAQRAAAGTGPAVLLISGGGPTAPPPFVRDLARLELGPLTAHAFAALAERLRPDWRVGHALPHALHAELWSLTGGLPALLNRLLRPEMIQTAQPPTLADLVCRCLKELPPDQHAVLAAAHALPGASAQHLRAALSGRLGGRLEDALAGLQARQWWREDRPTHPRLAEWAWAVWPWLERQELAERAIALVREWTDAGASGVLERRPPVRSPELHVTEPCGPGPLRPRQRGSADLCAAEAVSAYGLALTVEAEAAARRTLGLSVAGPAAVQALDVLANLALDQGRFGVARTLAARALAADPAVLAGALYTAAYLSDLLGDHGRAERLARGGLTRLSPAESPATLMAVLASSLDARGRFIEARHWHTLALHSARAQQSPYVLCEVISFMLWHLNACGQPQQAETLAREGLSLGPYDNAGYLRNSLGQALLLQGRLEGTLEELEPQLGRTNTTLAAMAHPRQALALHRMGLPDAARIALDHGAALLPLTEAGHPRYAWAVAALTIGPGEFGPQAARTVRGVRTNDYDLVQQFRRMTGRPPGR